MNILNAKEDEKLANENNSATPWLRFWARWIDYVVLFLLARILIVLVGDFPEFLKGTGTAVLLTLSLTIPIEAVCISAFGTTPGKWLGKIRVKKCEGGNPNFIQAIKRTCWVWVQGLGLSIPLLNLPLMWFAKKTLIKEGKTRWDKISGTNVEFMHLALWRYTIITVIAFSLFVLMNLSILDYILSLYFLRSPH